MIVVFFDGKCGLCIKEIQHYKKIAPKGIFNWQDITENPQALSAHGVSLAQGLKLLHALDKADRLHIGVDAFILIWQQLDRWRLLAKLVSLPGIYWLADKTYHIFAEQRFARLSHCQIAANNNY